MVRPKSELRKALEDVALAHQAAEAAASPQPTPPQTEQDLETRKRQTTALIERISATSTIESNKRNWDYESPEWKEVLQYVDPKFEAYWDNFPRALTFEENMGATRQMADKDPTYQMEIVEISSDVDEVQGEADVYMQIKVTGANVTFEGLSNLKWRRDRDGRWWCWQHVGMRTSEMNRGFV